VRGTLFLGLALIERRARGHREHDAGELAVELVAVDLDPSPAGVDDDRAAIRGALQHDEVLEAPVDDRRARHVRQVVELHRVRDHLQAVGAGGLGDVQRGLWPSRPTLQRSWHSATVTSRP